MKGIAAQERLSGPDEMYWHSVAKSKHTEVKKI